MPHPHTHALARDALSREAIRGEPALFVRRSSRRRGCGSSVLGGRCVFNTCNCSKKAVDKKILESDQRGTGTRQQVAARARAARVYMIQAVVAPIVAQRVQDHMQTGHESDFGAAGVDVLVVLEGAGSSSCANAPAVGGTPLNSETSTSGEAQISTLGEADPMSALAEAAEQQASRSFHHHEHLSVEQNQELAVAANIGRAHSERPPPAPPTRGT